MTLKKWRIIVKKTSTQKAGIIEFPEDQKSAAESLRDLKYPGCEIVEASIDVSEQTE